MAQRNPPRAQAQDDPSLAPRRRWAFWLGVALCGVALGGCAGSSAGPTQPTGVGPAAKVVFTVPPRNAAAGAAITPAVQVAVQDAQGNTVTTATTSITVAIGTNPASGTLSGTTTVAAVNGVATFSSLSLNTAGTGYTLTASATGLTGATSSAFNVVAPVSVVFAPVSAGLNDTCGVTTSGAAYCWGNNGQGQLGNGSTTDSYTPVAVSGGLSFATVSVSSNYYNTCGVTTSGAAYCWGDNVFGQLGNGSTTGPQQCLGVPCSTTPVAVSGGLSFATVSAGYNHTCGLTTSGAAYCWGSNGSGDLGNGSTTNSSTPVAVSGGLSFATVSAGYFNTCGVTTSGAAYCWGDNDFGQLGNGSTTGPQQCNSAPCSTTPVAVSGGLSFATVSAGHSHACALTTNGAAYCWGHNFAGDLGNGSTTDSSTPVAVSGGLTF